MLLLLLTLACRKNDPVDTASIDFDGDGSVASEDCDDRNAAVFPGAIEVCDGVDNDCSGAADDATGDLWYADADEDGFGDPEDSQQSCDGESGRVADSSDCDDGDAALNPLADEVCDQVDNDCDGEVDEDAIDAPDWYVDVDEDGYGDPGAVTRACEAPSGSVANDEDCDDSEAQVNPDADELCDGLDNDCDGDVDPDQALDASTWYADGDGDGYGSEVSTVACEAPSGWVDNADDCDDEDASAWPAATEVCDEVDNDCDGDVDEEVLETWYLDWDGDGYGDSGFSAEGCEAPTADYVDDATDCDDQDPDVNPGETEVCNGVDDDCDLDVDNGLPLSTWYADSDGDSYGDPDVSTDDCGQPSGYVSDDSDCDDSSADAYPGGTELCDELDNDCDGTVDNEDEVLGDEEECAAESCDAILTARSGATDGSYWIEDADGNGIEGYCEMDFEGGGWLAVFNMVERAGNNTQAAAMHASLINNADMSSAVLPTDTSASIHTSNLDLSLYTEVVYGWAASGSDVSRWGTYSSSSLVGECYLDGYCGAGVAIATMDIEPTGNSRTIYTGNSPTYPHVGLGFSGQIITWGYDNNSSSYGHWANWYDNNPCCNSGNTSDMQNAGWRYVIYIR